MIEDATLLAIQQLFYLFCLLFLEFGPVAVLDHPDYALDLGFVEIDAVVS